MSEITPSPSTPVTPQYQLILETAKNIWTPQTSLGDPHAPYLVDDPIEWLKTHARDARQYRFYKLPKGPTAHVLMQEEYQLVPIPDAPPISNEEAVKRANERMAGYSPEKRAELEKQFRTFVDPISSETTNPKDEVIKCATTTPLSSAPVGQPSTPNVQSIKETVASPAPVQSHPELARYRELGVNDCIEENDVWLSYSETKWFKVPPWLIWKIISQTHLDFGLRFRRPLPVPVEQAGTPETDAAWAAEFYKGGEWKEMARHMRLHANGLEHRLAYAEDAAAKGNAAQAQVAELTREREEFVKAMITASREAGIDEPDHGDNLLLIVESFFQRAREHWNSKLNSAQARCEATVLTLKEMEACAESSGDFHCRCGKPQCVRSIAALAKTRLVLSANPEVVTLAQQLDAIKLELEKQVSVTAASEQMRMKWKSEAEQLTASLARVTAEKDNTKAANTSICETMRKMAQTEITLEMERDAARAERDARWDSATQKHYEQLEAEYGRVLYHTGIKRGPDNQATKQAEALGTELAQLRQRSTDAEWDTALLVGLERNDIFVRIFRDGIVVGEKPYGANPIRPAIVSALAATPGGRP